MPKTHFSIKSDRQCTAKDDNGLRCRTMLKQSLVDRYPKADMCWKHWRENKDRFRHSKKR